MPLRGLAGRIFRLIVESIIASRRTTMAHMRSTSTKRPITRRTALRAGAAASAAGVGMTVAAAGPVRAAAAGRLLLRRRADLRRRRRQRHPAWDVPLLWRLDLARR